VSTIRNPLIVVTGLPRSGTSLMMQMLAGGGVSLVEDGHRPPDPNNPHGYFEDRRVRRLHLDNSWLHEVRGRAVKIISPLIHLIPEGLPCDFLFVHRPIEEILISQQMMLGRSGLSDPDSPEIRDRFLVNLEASQAWIQSRPESRLQNIEYHALLSQTQVELQKIVRFLDLDLPVETMAAVVDPKLYRSRSDTSAPRTPNSDDSFSC